VNSRGDGLDRGWDGKDCGAKTGFRRCRTAGLVVPVACALAFRTPTHVASAPRFGEPFVHAVGWRDTLSSITRRHGTTVADLQCALFLQFICQGIGSDMARGEGLERRSIPIGRLTWASS